jgi:hypothetical protein
MLRFGDYGNFSVWIGATAIVATLRNALRRRARWNLLKIAPFLLQTALIWAGIAEHAAKVTDLYPEGNHVGRRAGAADSIAARSAARNVVGGKKERRAVPRLPHG